MPSIGRDQLSVVCSEESDPLYRYTYTRTRHIGRGRAAVVLYNPVHRGDRTDPTTGKCMSWLCATGEIGEVTFVNLFAYRHRDPLALITMARNGIDVIGPRNDEFTHEAILRADLVIVAWGVTPRYVDPSRSTRVLSWITEPYCFGRNSGGSPVHPNRRGGTFALQRYSD